MPTFLVKHPERGEITFKLTGDRITVGRRSDNTVQINHGTISGHHAELVSVNGHYVLRDLDSTNHCFIDGIQISEADLNEHCKMLIGAIECEYIPDAKVVGAEGSSSGSSSNSGATEDSLRKMVGALRHQNEELIQKVSDQQNQIDILGSARLLTPATGADLNSLRAQVKTLTAERDKLQKENRSLLAEVDRLRALATFSEVGTLKATVPIPYIGANAKDDDSDIPTVAVSASGGATVAAPMARVVDPVAAALSSLTGLRARMSPVLQQLASEPANQASREELATVSAQMVERASQLGGHTAARLVSSLDALVRDVAHRPAPISSQIRGAIEQATDLLGRVLSPEVASRCSDLPAPGVLVVEDDKELLPAILSSLEFARLSAAGTGNAEDALANIHSAPVDLVLLDLGLSSQGGQDLCTQIRALPKHDRTPIVFLAGQEEMQQRGGGNLNGGSDVISKPVNMLELTLKTKSWAVKNQLGLA